MSDFAPISDAEGLGQRPSNWEGGLGASRSPSEGRSGIEQSLD